MSLQKIFQTGSTFALAAVTIAYPLSAVKVLANTANQISINEAIELTQNPAPPITTPPPTTAPTPAPAPATPAPSPNAAPEATPAPREDVPGLFERVEYINACRQTNRSVEIFADTALSPVNRVGSLGANAQVTLTGVLAPGRAQIIRRETPDSPIAVVGWVNSAYLTTCGSPTPTKTCYRINVPDLTLRSGPSSTSDYRGTLGAGSIVYATTTPPTEQTSPNTAPDFGRIWVEVLVRNDVVWIARTGPSGSGENATPLSGAECTGQ